MIGQKLLHYEIVEKLGEGGMGVVYKARDTRLDRFVALKFLPAEKIADAERKARFVQEAKSASALNHPNIITIHDIGENFIAMEYVAGKTLDQITPRRGMRLGDALKIAVQIADALTKAHAAGIVHRDLKPGNIMVDGDGRVKVLDFGLAKLTETALGEDEATRTMKPHTEEGTIVGTAAYMSPEQAQGKLVDARSDIFSFGSVLYEMVTGARAFRGDSRMSTLAAVLQSEPATRDVGRLRGQCGPPMARTTARSAVPRLRFANSGVALGAAIRMVGRECSMLGSIHWSTRCLNRLWITTWRSLAKAPRAFQQSAAGPWSRGRRPRIAPAAEYQRLIIHARRLMAGRTPVR